MSANSPVPLIVGRRGDYEWLVADRALGDLLEACPELVVGKYLAITCFDSGPLHINDVRNPSGWESRLGVMYSPEISTVGDLPYDNCYDEWYVLEAPRDIGVQEHPSSNPFEPANESIVFAMVNSRFGPNHKDSVVLNLFWRQLDRIRPLSYIADCNEYITLVTADRTAFAKARLRLANLPSR